jgi:hypothetical protein
LSTRPEIRIRYEVDGKTHEDTTYDVTNRYYSGRQWSEAAIAQFEVGKTYPCWYDPLNYDHAVLVRGYSGWRYLLLLLPFGMIAISAGGLIFTWSHWDTSAERRAVIQQRAPQIDVFEPVGGGSPQYPTVPGDANLTNSPGTNLKYRLPMAAPGWTLFGALIACLIWNGIVAVFVSMAIMSHLDGETSWALIAFTIPFALIGLGLVVYLFRQLLITTGVGPTRVEISHHPLFPGGGYQVFISQAGRLRMNSLQVLLACDEKATYRQGTDTRTDSCRVYEGEVLRKDEFEIEPQRPFEKQCPMQIPAGAMHSFRADHNEVNWKLVVRGEVAGWPHYEREFPLVVFPGTSVELT